MSEEKKNHFILRNQYPTTSSILDREKKTLSDIFSDALFVLDTNSLLVPYQTGKDDIEKIRVTYETLIDENRLFIPKHVLREFAKNRSTKLSELYTNIDNFLSSTPTIKLFEYPILGELDSYKKLSDTREEILVHLKEYKEYLKELKSGITNWNWSDPVTVMYSNTFSNEIIIDIDESEDELIKKFESRMSNNIPPGNKDKSKGENAIGDFIIWLCILELGKEKEKDVIFISNDEKNDWLLKGNKKSISTRFELVDEFWRETKGNNFICMTFSEFLEAQGLEIDIVEEEPSQNVTISKEEGPSTGSLEALERLFNVISEFLEEVDEEKNEAIYIERNIGSDISHFRDTYKNEFFDTEKWTHYFDYLYLFDKWLSKINSFNNEIFYQELRMKRDTRTEQILLVSLCKEFVDKYEEFELIK